MIRWILIITCAFSLFNCTSVPAPSSVQEPEADFSTEEQRLQIAIQINPEHWLGYFRISKFYQQQQQWSKALDSLQKAEKIAPDSIAIQRELGSLYQILKQEKTALVHYTEALGRFPENKILFLDRGKLYLKLQNPDQARLDFEKAVENNSEIFEAYLLLAFLNIQERDLVSALPLLLRAAEIEPEQAEVWQQISVLQEKLGNQKQAIDSMRKAVDLNPDDFGYLQSYASLLEKSYSTEELKIVLTSMLHLFPENAWPHAHYGNLLFHLERYPEAEIHLKQAVVYRQDYAWAFFRIGALHAEQKQWEEAAQSFLQGLEHESNNLWARKQLGAIYELQGKTEAAIEQYQRILDRGAKNQLDENVFHRLAQLYWSELRFRQAIETIQEGRLHFPESLDLSWKLARFLEARQEFAPAREIYLNILQQSPKNGEAMVRLGLLEQRMGNLKQSESYYRSALKISPALHQVRQQLIRLQLQSSEITAAEPELRRYIQENPNAEWGYAQLGLLKLLQKKPEEGLSILQSGLTHNPNSSWLQEIKGLSHEKLQQWAPALSSFQAALQNSPDSPFLLAHQGFVLTHLTEFERARQSLLRSLLLSDIETWAWYQYLLVQETKVQEKWFGQELFKIRPLLEQILLEQNDTDMTALSNTDLSSRTKGIIASVLQLLRGQRQSALNTVSKLSLDNLQAWEVFQIGYIFEINGNYQEAEHYYHRIQQSNPDFPWIHARLARVYEKQDRISESIQAYTDFVSHFEAPMWALSRLASHLGASKRNHEAVAIFQQILKITPNDADTLNNIAWLYLTTGPLQSRKIQQALIYARQAVAILSTQEHLDTLAEAYFQSGQIDLALKTIKEAILKTNSQSEQFQYLMGQYQRFRKGDLHSLPDADVLNTSQ
ncbi:MAG: tetratricopeptide repeat protein [SAR324 cluster bacterium]|nr:tetratricopeptide repeat protein [SAR324 cluster bacterium]